MGGAERTDDRGRPLPFPQSPVTIGRIVLAREAPVRLGVLAIDPALRRIVHDDGREEILEPRVMQVLVTLIQAAGAIVTRDDLTTSCWHGVVVGEDAISRVMSRLRRLAEGLGEGTFKLETITKVGYRLVSTPRISGPPRSPPVAPEPLLAVLAFDNLCDGAMEWFSEGVSLEIQQTIAASSGLKVIGRASSFQFRGPEKAAANVGAALRATHVLDGSVRRGGDRVRISAELIECAGQTTLWSERFDRDLADILELQDEIAQAVVAALKATFAGAAPIRKIDPAAYDLYLRAAGSEEGHVSHVQAIDLLERAVRGAPQFASAWGALARVRATLYRQISLDEQTIHVSRAEVVAAADAALSLDPNCALALIARAEMLPWGDYHEREILLNKALGPAPHGSWSLTAMAWFLATVGRTHEALRLGASALELDPLNRGAANLYSQLLAAVGRYEESRRAYGRYRDKWPLTLVFTFAPIYLAAKAGDWAEFDRLREMVEKQGHSGQHTRAALSMGRMLREPSAQRRERLLDILQSQLETTGTPRFGELVLAHEMGLRDEAFSLIARATFKSQFDPEGPPPAGVQSPGLIFDRSCNRAMMEDIRFVGFCARIGLCDYWVQSGQWPDCAGFVPYDFETEARRLATVEA